MAGQSEALFCSRESKYDGSQLRPGREKPGTIELYFFPGGIPSAAWDLPCTRPKLSAGRGSPQRAACGNDLVRIVEGPLRRRSAHSGTDDQCGREPKARGGNPPKRLSVPHVG